MNNYMHRVVGSFEPVDGTWWLRNLGRSIELVAGFGRKGHAAIVDQTGRGHRLPVPFLVLNAGTWLGDLVRHG